MHEHLTNEDLCDLYGSSFELTSKAIALAQHKIQAGKEFSLTKILSEIKHKPEPVLHEQEVDAE